MFPFMLGFIHTNISKIIFLFVFHEEKGYSFKIYYILL